MSSFLGYRYVYPIQVESETDLRTITSLSLNTLQVGSGNQRWRLSITLEDRKPDSADNGRLYAQLLGKQGQPFNVPMPQLNGQYNAPNLIVRALTTAGNKAVPVFLGNSFTNLRIGHFVSLSGHNKVYQVIGKNGNSSTTAEVVLFPEVAVAQNRNTVVNTNPNIRVIVDPQQELSYFATNAVSPILNLVEYF